MGKGNLGMAVLTKTWLRRHDDLRGAASPLGKRGRSPHPLRVDVPKAGLAARSSAGAARKWKARRRRRRRARPGFRGAPGWKRSLTVCIPPSSFSAEAPTWSAAVWPAALAAQFEAQLHVVNGAESAAATPPARQCKCELSVTTPHSRRLTIPELCTPPSSARGLASPSPASPFLGCSGYSVCARRRAPRLLRERGLPLPAPRALRLRLPTPTASRASTPT